MADRDSNFPDLDREYTDEELVGTARRYRLGQEGPMGELEGVTRDDLVLQGARLISARLSKEAALTKPDKGNGTHGDERSPKWKSEERKRDDATPPQDY